MKTRITALLLACLMLLPFAAHAEVTEETADHPIYPYTWHSTKKPVRSYTSPTLVYTVETASIEGCKCYITKVWMQDPGRQITKATATWRTSLMLPEKMASKVPGCALAINGSGYVSPAYPEIPDNYPGTSEDYYYTPLGSLTVTDGVIYRDLEGVPYYGLTLQADGLHMHVGEENENVLAASPTQTWSFYVRCPMIRDHAVILDREWPFAQRHAARTIIACMDANNYVIITATSSVGLTLNDAVDFLTEAFDPAWAYDLDGGPSSALICRNYGKKTPKVVYGGKAKDADLMVFTELSE